LTAWLNRPATVACPLISELHTPAGNDVEPNYNRSVRVYNIANLVPTPEEMGELLGLSSDRVKSVRRIMSAPAQSEGARSNTGVSSKRSANKSRRVVTKK
jgi:hypothetical protein